MDNIVLLSIPLEELSNLIKTAVANEFQKKKEKQLLNFKEVCQLLNISASALNSWKAKNQIPFKKIGGRVFFDKTEILEAMKDSRYKKAIEIRI